MMFEGSVVGSEIEAADIVSVSLRSDDIIESGLRCSIGSTRLIGIIFMVFFPLSCRFRSGQNKENEKSTENYTYKTIFFNAKLRQCSARNSI